MVRLWGAARTCSFGTRVLGLRALTGRTLSTVPAKPLRLEPQLESVLSRFRAKGGPNEKEGAARLVEDMERLQSRKVMRVLLVCSDYDSYTFEEDGLLTELVDAEYSDNNLSKPPTIERVSTPEKAIARVRDNPSSFDLIITLLRNEGHHTNAASFVSSIQQLNSALPVSLLALNPSELTSIDPRIDRNLRLNVNKRLMWETGDASLKAGSKVSKTDAHVADAWVWPFVWQGNVSIFPAMFKAVEDRLNLATDVEFGVQSIILVEDNVKFYSTYLPLLYHELWKVNQSIKGETMTVRERMLRMKSRPKVMLCTNYEEALDIYSRYSENIIGVITDAGFPRGGEHDNRAGLKLAEHILSDRPSCPVLVQSADAGLQAPAEQCGAKFASKSAPSLLHEIRSFVQDNMMFGPLVFKDGVSGNTLGKVSNVTELLETWKELPETSVAYHARRSDLSTWFFARAEFTLAKRFRASNFPRDFIDDEGRERADWLRNWILSETRAHRNKLASGVENAHAADAATAIARLGKGSLGGKGRGFRFLHSVSEKYGLATLMPDLKIVTPRCFILATEVFDRFIELNELMLPALSATSDDEIRRMFEQARLPDDVTAELRRYLQTQSRPVAVRSSSLFEDAFLQPFAGIYRTVMTPNRADSLDERVDELSWAVRMVYASTYSQQARRYLESTNNRMEEEKMAVIMQEVVGEERGDHFYPSLAGVANSVDFYPRPHTLPEHGCAQLALGLGFGVVDNMPSMHVSLGDPSSPISGFTQGGMSVSALRLTAKPSSLRGGDQQLVQLDPSTEAATLALSTVPKLGASVPAPQAMSSVPLTQDVHGEQVVFKAGYGDAAASSAPPPTEPAPLPLERALSGEAPLASALSFLLRLGSAGLGCPVEIEFALKLRQDSASQHELHVLQLRPQAGLGTSSAATRFRYLPTKQYASVTSKHALGHGRFEQICDVVYVPPHLFDPCRTEEMAMQIHEVNARLRAEGRKCLLMAPGRWGSAQKSMGIPVAWSDIDSSAFIVETQVPGGANVPLSQGSHFFQNLLSFGLGYATVDPVRGELADYEYWDSLPQEKSSTELVKHVRLASPLEIVVDGMSRRGVVMKPDKPFEVYVGQVDAFMAIQEAYTEEQTK
eukprot:CAMPEP_0119066418 /NCGR_PEP_ID=MMETSP1178-20130426/8965_1 /TAXON_ID=33656 /ORGANISM="unid sp, Strain CCMP2000" /LENGTH=1126 /DNA_ID=CAMNT_0007048017 /DNA_START=54 /DNA_END=3434 /DNA_ORIENTATION=+